MVHSGNTVYRLSVYTEVDSCSSEMVVWKTRTSSATPRNQSLPQMIFWCSKSEKDRSLETGCNSKWLRMSHSQPNAKS